MENNNEFKDIVQNHAKMTKYKTSSDRIGKIYMCVCGSLFFIAFCCMFITANLEAMADLVVIGAIFGFGYGGAYRRSSYFAAAAPVAAMFGLVMAGSLNFMYFLLLPLSLILAVLTVRANKLYDYLSKQPGFPQFDELFEESKKRSEKASREKEEYFERFKAMALSDSNDFGEPAAGIAEKPSMAENGGYMDSI
ncbi:MAG: hypothetical protein K5884_05010 [Ruminococcus sp.]|nr:hypothetical protein [Ruminococcus sp.]